jgi:hypothetical protein
LHWPPAPRTRLHLGEEDVRLLALGLFLIQLSEVLGFRGGLHVALGDQVVLHGRRFLRELLERLDLADHHTELRRAPSCAPRRRVCPAPSCVPRAVCRAMR